MTIEAMASQRKMIMSCFLKHFDRIRVEEISEDGNVCLPRRYWSEMVCPKSRLPWAISRVIYEGKFYQTNERDRLSFHMAYFRDCVDGALGWWVDHRLGEYSVSYRAQSADADYLIADLGRFYPFAHGLHSPNVVDDRQVLCGQDGAYVGSGLASVGKGMSRPDEWLPRENACLRPDALPERFLDGLGLGDEPSADYFALVGGYPDERIAGDGSEVEGPHRSALHVFDGLGEHGGKETAHDVLYVLFEARIEDTPYICRKVLCLVCDLDCHSTDFGLQMLYRCLDGGAGDRFALALSGAIFSQPVIIAEHMFACFGYGAPTSFFDHDGPGYGIDNLSHSPTLTVSL
jgi:hypothetical protein